MIVACVPSVVALYAWLILRRPIGALRTLGVVLSLLGVAVILSGGDLPSLLAHGVSAGDALILGCLVTWAAYTIAGGEVMRTTTPLSAVAWSCMFLLGYIGTTPILGLPGCVMYYKSSIFDLVVPRLLAGDHMTRDDIAAMGHGGYCSACAECRFPLCPFGKGA